MLKSHTCGELRLEHSGQEVTLAGWVHRRRDHGNIIFVDLRDRFGITQCVFDPSRSQRAYEIAASLKAEWVIQVRGLVAPRPAGMANPNLSTGDIEVHALEASVLNESKPLPFEIADEQPAEETLRLKYRYLDLRRPRMQRNLTLRHRVIKFMRDYLDARGFLEIETPMLIKSTPEGARDYVVPSRIHPGEFYALPQSPQQLKQLLMVAGYERYFQIARCFRDEDLRADRQPEFTQLDLEMSFVDQNDILDLIEDLYTKMVASVTPEWRVLSPFPRLRYDDTIALYGTDKPDLRFGMTITDLTDSAVASGFRVFRETAATGGAVRAIVAPGCSNYSRSQIDDLTATAKSLGAKGLVTFAVEHSQVRSPVAKFLSDDELAAIVERTGAQDGDLILAVADKAATASAVLGELRRQLGARLGLAQSDLLAFAFITDFPLFDWSEEEQRWAPAHHPFTMPHEEDIPLLDTDPARVRAKCYDLVCNGYELASGSIRIHRRDIQEKVFALLAHTPEAIEERFGHLLRAFEYGAPPHGGIAPGIDRLVMLMAGESNIRQVIAFPKTQSAVDLMFGAPSPISEEQLRELHLALLAEPGKEARQTPVAGGAS